MPLVLRLVSDWGSGEDAVRPQFCPCISKRVSIQQFCPREEQDINRYIDDIYNPIITILIHQNMLPKGSENGRDVQWINDRYSNR